MSPESTDADKWAEEGKKVRDPSREYPGQESQE